MQRASEPWTGGPFFFQDPVGDFIYEPSLTDHLFLALASQPLGARSPEAWAAELLGLEGCSASEAVVVDGAEGLIGTDCGVTVVSKDDRGYLIFLYVSGDDPEVGEVYNRAWFDQVLATVQLNPQSALPSPSPTSSPFVVDAVWSPDSADHDWPGIIRTEPDGPPVLIDAGPIADPTGDFARNVPGWIDIREVKRYSRVDIYPVYVYLADALKAVGDPADSWVAYGLVIDVDGDGVADHRVGMDNAGVGGDRRGWGTDLHTGASSVGGLDWDTSVGAFSGWGLERAGLPDESMYFRWHVRDPQMRYYVWASLIRDGRLVATDFAPDVGWIPVET